MHEKKHRIPTHVLYKIFIYVALIALAISIIVPVAWVFMASLKKNAEFIGADINPWALPKQFYYQNFVVAFQDARMGDFFLNSFIVTALALALLLILALPASYVLARFKFRGKKFFNGAFMAGLFINVNYIVVPIFLMLSSWNKALKVDFFLDNRFILALIYASCNLPFTIYLLSGYFQTLPKGFEEAAYMDGCGYFKTMVKIMIPMAKPSILTALIYASCNLPFTIYLLSGYFQTLPKGFEEAAYMDGCGYFKTMVKIMIPMAKPSILTVIMFNFLTFWNEYIIAYTLMDENGTLAMGLKNLMAVERTATNYGIIAYTLMDENGTLAMGLKNLMAVERTATNYGIMYAGLVIVMIPVLILYICVQKRLTEGMTLGGLKG